VLGAGVLLAALAVVGIVVLLKGSSEGGGDRPRGTVRAKITLERAVQPDTLLEEVGFPPHIQPALPAVLDRVRGCRLTGGGIDFTGRAPGGLTPAR